MTVGQIIDKLTQYDRNAVVEIVSEFNHYDSMIEIIKDIYKSSQNTVLITTKVT